MQIFRVFLAPLSLVYGLAVGIRNALFNWRWLKIYQPKIPAISVGNLSTGGEGKTPLTEYLITLLQPQYRVATLSRGYGRKTQGFLLASEKHSSEDLGDEPMQYFLKFRDIKVAVSEKRVIGIENLMQISPAPEVVLLDDAFQHRWVNPGFSVLVTSYGKIFTVDHLLPWGNLRESKKAYKRANIIVVSKCPPNLNSDEAKKLRNLIQPCPHQQLFFTTVQYGDLMAAGFSKRPQYKLAELSQKTVVVVTGIAQPDPLLHYLTSFNIKLIHLRFKDHHAFTQGDMERIKRAYDQLPESEKGIILTTEKDASRLGNMPETSGLPFYYLPIKIQFLHNGQEQFNISVLNFLKNFNR